METKGFCGSLFDLSFTEFVTTRLVKVLFLLGIGLAGLSALGVLLSGFSRGILGSLGGLILAPLLFLLWVLSLRITLEVIIVLFRIAENTGRLVEQGKAASAPPASE